MEKRSWKMPREFPDQVMPLQAEVPQAVPTTCHVGKVGRGKPLRLSGWIVWVSPGLLWPLNIYFVYSRFRNTDGYWY